MKLFNRKLLKLLAPSLALAVSQAAIANQWSTPQQQPEWNRVDIQHVNREAPHANVLPYQNVSQSDNILSLNGRWKFHWSENPNLRPDGFWQTDFDDKQWPEMQVPANWELNGYGRPFYVNSGYVFAKTQPHVPVENNHVGIYRRTIDLPSNWLDKQVFIHLGAVETAFYLWVNGNRVGYSQGSKTPAEFDVSSFVHAGTNSIVLEVYRWNDSSYLEDVDAWRLTGITRDVVMYTTPKVRVRDYHIKAGLDSSYLHGELNLAAKLNNHSQADFRGSATLSVTKDNRLIKKLNQVVRLSANSSDTEVNFTTQIRQVLAWSAESPELYQMKLELFDNNGRLVQQINDHLGFRTIEISQGQLLVNGTAVTLRGVNRHEHDMRTGHVVSKQSMEQDMALLKQFNVNAVRTAHYPNDPYWYKLADQYGLYIVDEANIESHGYMNDRLALGNLPEWQDAHMVRMQAMVERDKNHPSVIIWSLGNEAAGGVAFQKMYDWTKSVDPTRPVQYQAAGLVDYTDIYVPFYRSAQETERYLTGDPQKPLIHSEYAHAMGNSLGNFQQHWDVIYKYPMAQGGFIWDWKDQGLLKLDQAGNEYFAYGGDFGPQQVSGLQPPKKPLRGNFLANGILQADGTPNPHAWEMKKVFQPVRFDAVDISSGQFSLTNLRDFNDTLDLSFNWLLEENGKVLATGDITLPALNAGAMRPFRVELPHVSLKPNSEYFITLQAKTKQASRFVPAQHLVAWQQFKLPWLEPAETLDLASYPKLKLDQSAERIRVSAGRFAASFNAENGQLKSLKYDDIEMVRSGLEANFWRPLTDNDIGGKLHISSKQWKNAPKKFETKAQIKVERFSDKVIELTVSRNNGNRFNYQTEYLIFASGDIKVKSTLRPIQENGKDLLRFGMTMTLPGEFQQLSWFGKGPHESYADRQTSAVISLYQGTVSGQYHPYARPQETGNKMAVRWLSLSNKRGYGLLVKGAPTFSGSVLPVNNSDLYFTPTKNKHGKLIKPKDLVTLNIDKKQIGVGGDNSWNEKGLSLPQYRLPWQYYQQEFHLRPFGPDQDLQQLTSQELPDLPFQ